jgi:RNA polymerase sigma-70 factor, ECF subfamily
MTGSCRRCSTTIDTRLSGGILGLGHGGSFGESLLCACYLSASDVRGLGPMTNRPDNSSGSGSACGDQSVSKTLIEQARDHDEEAWRRLTAFCSPLVYVWCRRFDVQPEDAADLLQEVLVAMHRNLATFRRDRPGDTFRGWLWTVTRSKIHDFLRDRASRPLPKGGTVTVQWFQELPEHEPPANQASPSGSKLNNPALKVVEALRGDFEDRTWRAFWRTTVDERPAAEVAVEIGMTVNAVRKAKSRVLQRLRSELNGLVE